MTLHAQQTLARTVTCVGVGLHSGAQVRMGLHPAPEHTGIRFLRRDVRGFDPEVLADYRNVTDTNLGTTLSNGEGTLVSTVEHLMAAFWGCGIDNARVELDGPEVPIMDGSAEPFVFLIDCAGLREQSAPRRVVEVLRHIEVREQDKHVTIVPAEDFSVSLEIAYDHPLIGSQLALFNSSSLSFKNDLCRARTFGFEHEVSSLRERGLARGGSLENAIVISSDGVLNSDGLRYPNEFVRHKILDCIGDCFLAGGRLLGHVTGYRSGHGLNNRLLHTFFADTSAWRLRESTA